jgi:tripeptidyl-peptidase-1
MDIPHISSQGYMTREVLLKYYNIPNNLVSKNVSVGAMEFEGNDGFNQHDMLEAQNASLVPENPVSPDHLLGANLSPPDTESELDMAVVWMAAANSNLWYVDYPGWIFGWANYMMNRDDIPQVVSLSWGWDEDDQCSITLCPKNVTSKQYVEYTNYALMKLTARGMTIVVASGDAGSPGRTNELCDPYRKNINPIFPGGSPWVLSVGGSYLQNVEWKTPMCTNHLSCPSMFVESITSFNETGWTSGSGFTEYDKTPVWQQKVVTKYLNSGVPLPESKYFNRNGRGYPDMTAFGHKCAMHDFYMGWTGVDGTSCSAPIVAGILTFINQYQLDKGRPLLGFVNPLLYKLYDQNPTTFNNIWQGNSGCTEQKCCHPSNNYGFVPKKGMWDVVKGLGSPNVGNILKEIDSLF